MKKRFVRKRKVGKRFLKRLKVVLVIVIVFMSIWGLSKMTITVSKQELYEHLLYQGNHHFQKPTKGVIENQLLSFIVNFNLKNPISLLEKEFPMSTVTTPSKPVFQTQQPLIYLYNTHPLETYYMENLEVHNITPSIVIAIQLLKEKMDGYGLETFVETADVTKDLKENGLSYVDSYKITRGYLEKRRKQYPSLKYFIDFHRDAVKKEVSTATIDKKTYAKILFVVGKKHKNYEQNLKVANALNERIKKKYPNLTRGVITKEGEGVDGIYNQDISSNVLLVECGGFENTIEEVARTIQIFASILKEYIGEQT